MIKICTRCTIMYTEHVKHHTFTLQYHCVHTLLHIMWTGLRYIWNGTQIKAELRTAYSLPMSAKDNT